MTNTHVFEKVEEGEDSLNAYLTFEGFSFQQYNIANDNRIAQGHKSNTYIYALLLAGCALISLYYFMN